MLVRLILQQSPPSHIYSSLLHLDPHTTPHPGEPIPLPVSSQLDLLDALHSALNSYWSKSNETIKRQQIEYADKLVKHVVSRCERAGNAEIEEGLLDMLGELNSHLLSFKESNEKEKTEEAQTVERWYLVDPEKEPVKVVEDKAGILTRLGTTGLRTWEACLRCVEFLMSPPLTGNPISERLSRKEGRNNIVVELGAGCGLLGLSVAQLFPSTRVILSDFDENVLARLETNVELNKQLKTVSVERLEWSAPLPDSITSLTTLEKAQLTILAADVTYDPASFPFLTSTLSTLLSLDSSGNGGRAYLAATIRSTDTWSAFLAELDKAKLGYAKVESWPELQERLFWHPDESARGKVGAPVELLEISLTKM